MPVVTTRYSPQSGNVLFLLAPGWTRASRVSIFAYTPIILRLRCFRPDEPQHGGMNQAIYVKADGQSMYFEPLGMQPYGGRREKLTFEGAAELFWALFIRPLQE